MTKQLIIKSLAILLLIALFIYKNKPRTADNNKQELIENTYNQRYIILENTNLDYVVKMIQQYGEIIEDTTNQIEYNFKIGTINNWFIIEIDSLLDNYEYYNLPDWFYGFDANNNAPSFAIGYFKGNEIENKSYLFFTDLEKTACDAAVGVFSTNENFSIYLPEAYKDSSLEINNDTSLIFFNIINELRNNNLDISKIIEIEFEKYIIKMNKSS